MDEMDYRMKRRLVFFTFLFFSFARLFAVPEYVPPKKDYKNFHGKRMMDKDKGFHLLFLKTNKFPESYNFELVFSKPVDPESVNKECFLLNGSQLQMENLRFSKNYSLIAFSINVDSLINEKDFYELVVKDIKSINGKTVGPVSKTDFQFGQEYRFLRKGWNKNGKDSDC